MPLVFQYGSNCSEARLNSPDRLNGNARTPRPVQTVGEYDIVFDVWSQGNGCAASDLVEKPGRHAWGVLYDIPLEWIFGRRNGGGRTLQQIEGRCYQPRDIRVGDANGNVIEEPVITFLGRPEDRRQGLWTSAAYVGHIVTGLRAHGVHEEYIQHVVEVAISANRRAQENADQQIRLIEALREPPGVWELP